MTKQNKSKVEFFILMAAFGSMGLIVKAINLPSVMIVCLRAWISSLFLILFLTVTKKWPKNNLKIYTPMLLSGVMIAGDWLGLFVAYNYTTVAVATVCYYTAPVILLIFSFVLLKEKCTVKNILCIVISFVGLFLVSNIKDFTGFAGPMFSLLGAVCYALIIIINKKFPDGDPIVKTTIQLFVAAILTTPYVLFTTDFSTITITLKDILLLIFLGVVLTAVAYIFYFTLILDIPAKSVAICSYADPLVSVLVSVTLLGEPLSVAGATGALLIILSSLFSELGK